MIFAIIFENINDSILTWMIGNMRDTGCGF
jgi:hypothetical protein